MRDLLLQSFEADPGSILKSNTSQSEATLVHGHINRLVLLSKLVTFSKHGKDILSKDKPSDALLRKLDSTLPQKFNQEDQQRLQEVLLQGSYSSILVSHLVACLNDSLIVSLGKRANMAKCKLVTYASSCSPTSQIGQALQASVQYALEALSILLTHGQDA